MICYKEFVDNVEERAINTLRSTVSRLLLDFENWTDKNKIKEKM